MFFSFLFFFLASNPGLCNYPLISLRYFHLRTSLCILLAGCSYRLRQSSDGPRLFFLPQPVCFFFSHLARWQLPRLNLELFTIRWNHVRPLLPFVFLIYKNNHQNGTSNCILRLCSLYKTRTGGQKATLFNGDSDLGGGATELYTST